MRDGTKNLFSAPDQAPGLFYSPRERTKGREAVWPADPHRGGRPDETPAASDPGRTATRDTPESPPPYFNILLFREMVADPESRRDLVRICLPDRADQIDLDTMTAIDATFTGGKQADLLVSMIDNRGRVHLVYMLVEHKSYVDRSVCVQLYRYLGAIWQQEWIHKSAEERGPLPVIHPIVLYHGKASWTVPRSLIRLHSSDTSDAGPFITDLVYRLVDISTLEPEHLHLAARTLAHMITLRYVLRPISPGAARVMLQLIMAPEVDPPVRERLLEYLVDHTAAANTDLLMTEWEAVGYTIEGGDIMTMAQELMRRGEVKGREEGREEGLKEAAQGLLAMGVSLDIIHAATGLTEEQIVDVRNRTDADGTNTATNTQTTETHDRDTDNT